jgi:hypothetical protein
MHYSELVVKYLAHVAYGWDPYAPDTELPAGLAVEWIMRAGRMHDGESDWQNLLSPYEWETLMKFAKEEGHTVE